MFAAGGCRRKAYRLPDHTSRYAVMPAKAGIHDKQS
jgi:hypothetical protein